MTIVLLRSGALLILKAHATFITTKMFKFQLHWSWIELRQWWLQKVRVRLDQPWQRQAVHREMSHYEQQRSGPVWSVRSEWLLRNGGENRGSCRVGMMPTPHHGLSNAVHRAECSSFSNTHHLFSWNFVFRLRVSYQFFFSKSYNSHFLSRGPVAIRNGWQSFETMLALRNP